MKALFYSLHAAIWRHAAVENYLVAELTRRGLDTVYVTCGATFQEHCTSYSSENIGLDAPRKEKDKICRNCTSNALLLAEGNKANHLKLRNFVSSEDEFKINKMLVGVDRKNFMKFSHLGVNVGTITSYESFLLYKKMSENLSEKEWPYYHTYLRNALQSLVGFSKIFKLEKPDIVFFYSPQYGVNGVCAQYAALNGAKTYFIEGSANNAERYTALRIWDWEKHGLLNPALKYWPEVQNKVTAGDVKRVTGHFKDLWNARSYAVYSKPAMSRMNIRKKFKIPSNPKILLATLSSYDESYAAFKIGKFPSEKVLSKVYKNQFLWIKDTIKYLKGRKDLYFIIRIHPRDYPNKRDNRQSEQAAFWEKILKKLPQNIRVNWPQDSVSLYNILNQVDAVVTGWSATGVEALICGVPVVTYDQSLPSFPSEIHLTGNSRREYFKNIENAIKSNDCQKFAINGYWWLAANYSLGTVRFTALSEEAKILRKSRFMPNKLRKWIEEKLNKKNKRKDIKGGFLCKTDADCFYEMILHKKSNLYEAKFKNIENTPSNIILRSIKDELTNFKIFTREQ